jgi:hypothetical protein
MSGGLRRFPRGWRRTVIATAAVLLTGATVDAQTGGERFEVGAGMRFVGPEPLGRVDATETNPGGGAFRLFTAESTLDSLLGVEARLGIRVTSALHLEATGSYGSSDLKVKLSADAENAAAITATERIGQYTVEGAAVMELTRWHVGAHGVPFIAAGAGYVRALHEDRILVDEGALWHAGGGVNLLLRSNPDGRLGLVGIRLDARALFQSGVVSDGVHASPAFGASAFVRF